MFSKTLCLSCMFLFIHVLLYCALCLSFFYGCPLMRVFTDFYFYNVAYCLLHCFYIVKFQKPVFIVFNTLSTCYMAKFFNIIDLFSIAAFNFLCVAKHVYLFLLYFQSDCLVFIRYLRLLLFSKCSCTCFCFISTVLYYVSCVVSLVCSTCFRF